MNTNKKESGQVLLIVILAMVVTVTFVLAVTAKTITSIKDTQQQKQSEQAFSAAEAGVEDALKQSSGSVNGNFGSVQFTANINALNGQGFILNNGQPVAKDDGIDIWLSDYNSVANSNYANGMASPSFDIYWNTPSNTDCSSDGQTNSVAAVEVLLFSASNSTVPGSAVPPYSNISPIQRFVFDPCNGSYGSGQNRASSVGNGNGFNGTVTTASSGIASFNKSFVHRATITGSGVGLIARVVPLYASTPIGVYFNKTRSDSTYPSQGKQITSTGTNGTLARKLLVFQGYPQIPNEFMQYLLLVPN